MEETPARWREKITRSTAGPECPSLEARGGYIVQPVPAPPLDRVEASNRRRDGIKSQNLILFSRGKDISGARPIRGISQLPNPPIIAGITIKKNYNESMGGYDHIK